MYAIRSYYAGFISYEAAPGFDADLHVNINSDFPLLWFGIFKDRREIEAGELFPIVIPPIILAPAFITTLSPIVGQSYSLE